MDKHIIWSIVIKNCVALICWTALAIIFAKWWIALFAIIFFCSFDSKSKDKDK